MNLSLLKILRCPETHQPLTLADAAFLEKVNQQIAAGQRKNRAGQTLSEKLDGGLLRQDGKMLYPIRGALPILLVDEAVVLL